MSYTWLRFGSIAAAVLAVSAQPVSAQSTLAPRVLLVYNSADPSSVAIAGHYQAVRGVPAANLCAITPPATLDVQYSDYITYMRNPIRACLNAVGPQNVLYIVLAYLRAAKIYTPAGSYYAVDSFLSDVWDQYTTQTFGVVPTAAHRYYADSQSQGNSFIPFQSLAAYRATSGAQLIYSVWRFEGTTPAIASAQIDQAMAATAAGGLLPISSVAGSPPNACLDSEIDPTTSPDAGYRTADWDLYRMNQAAQQVSQLNTIFDTNSATFGTPPAPNCPNTGFYNGWYNYGSYNNAFAWDQGAIGWDLDSGALADPRNVPWWGAGAIANGITVTSGPVTEPYLEGMARPAVLRNLLEGANVGDAFLRNTRWLKWMILNVGDPLYQPFPGGVAPFNPPAGANALQVLVGQGTFRAFVGPQPLAVKVSLASPAAGSGTTVSLSSNNSALSFPSSVTVPAGQSSVLVAGTAAAVTNAANVYVTATVGTSTVGNTISLYPLLSGVGVPSTTVKGGTTIQAFVGLNANAPTIGVSVQLSSDSPSVASVPASATISPGFVAAPISITTKSVTANTTVNITSSYAGATNILTLTVTP